MAVRSFAQFLFCLKVTIFDTGTVDVVLSQQLKIWSSTAEEGTPKKQQLCQKTHFEDLDRRILQANLPLETRTGRRAELSHRAAVGSHLENPFIIVGNIRHTESDCILATVS